MNPDPGDNPFSPVPVLSERLLVALAVCIAAIWVAWTGATWFRYHPHLPWRDLFLLLAQVRELAELPLSVTALLQWFEPHYGTHRIAIPRLLLLIDTRLLAGQNHAFYAAGWFCLLLMAALYTRMAASYFQQPRTTLFAAALACIWLFSPAHLWNLVNPINVSWHLTLSFSLLAFYLLLHRYRAPRLWVWCIAYLLCALAAFSTFAGVLAWLQDRPTGKVIETGRKTTSKSCKHNRLRESSGRNRCRSTGFRTDRGARGDRS